MSTRLSFVPSDYASRRQLWIRSGLWLSFKEGPFVTLSVKGLGYAERQLLDWEERIAALATVPASRRTELESLELESLIMECAAHSILWVFGLYEIVRVVKDTNPSRFEPLAELFQKLAILRMPLAKHEVKSAPGYRKVPHYPTGFWFPIGWKVRNPHTRAYQRFTRTGIANEFLSITATEPIFQVATETSAVEPPPLGASRKPFGTSRPTARPLLSLLRAARRSRDAQTRERVRRHRERLKAHG
jgi:hypothetical protein